jgi:pyridoxine 5'-phosphate synthase PdxJ
MPRYVVDEDVDVGRLWGREGRKPCYERVKVVAEVDEFVMRVCLLALEDATGVNASFLVQTPAIIELSIGYYFKRKGKETDIDALLEQVATVKKKARPKNLDVS